MNIDKHYGAGEGGTEGDCSERDLAVLQDTNSQLSGLASQPSFQAHLPTSTSTPLPLSVLRSNNHSTEKEHTTEAEGTCDESTIADDILRKGNKHRRKSLATPILSIHSPAMSRQDLVQEPQRSPVDPVAPQSLPRIHSQSPPLSSFSLLRTREHRSSLHRSVLARNMHGQPGNSDSAMELQPMTALAGQQTFAHCDFDKNLDGTMTIVPVLKTGDYTETHPHSTDKAHEMLALPHYETWIKSKAAHSRLLSRLRAAKDRLRKKILRIQEIPPSKNGRHIEVVPYRMKPLVDERTGRKYISNTITSSRYTLYNFLPRQLFAQFSRLANFYFLCVSFLQMIPGLSTTGTYTTIVPLAFFVTISMAKEGYDDLRRYRLDKAENRKTALTLRGPRVNLPSTDNIKRNTATSNEQYSWEETEWAEIGVGDVVKIVRNESAPADLAVLHTKGTDGIAYVETLALDGETSLKSKQALPQLARSCRTPRDIAGCEAHIVVEDPNLDLYNLEGRVAIGAETLPLTNNEIIYRGSVLRNTFEAIGIVVYSGEECKIRMNATKNPRIKAVSTRTSHKHLHTGYLLTCAVKPALQNVVNKVVIILVVFVVVLAIFNTVAYQIWQETTEEKAWYLTNASVAFFPILVSFIILFNTMIPLSLYVSLEIVKLFQMLLMSDVDMYDEVSNTPMEARTSTINEELGQVK